MGAGSCRLDIVGRNCERAAKRLGELDLVMLAIAIDVNHRAPAAFRHLRRSLSALYRSFSGKFPIGYRAACSAGELPDGR